MATAPIGHNRAPDPFEAFELELESLFEEASNFLDGQLIENQQQADDVSALLNRLRKATKDADEFRKTEKRPHDEAAAAVQTKWLPSLERAKLAAETAKNALATFLTAQELAQRAAAEALRKEAEEAAEAAAQTALEVRPDDLAGQTTAKIKRENAIALGLAAEKAGRARPQAKGGERAVSLRSRWTAILSDSAAALKHYRDAQPAELREWLLGQAQRDVNAGERAIPGFTINEERRAQ